jgi:tetraacyldisaccharide 4'-kinase
VDAGMLRLPMHDSREGLHGRKAFAFAALARNENFFLTVSEMGADLQGVLGYDDHHPYSLDDIHQIAGAALKTGSDCLVTTDKDLVRIPHAVRLPLDLIVLGITMDFQKDRDRFAEFIVSHVLRPKPAFAAF